MLGAKLGPCFQLRTKSDFPVTEVLCCRSKSAAMHAVRPHPVRSWLPRQWAATYGFGAGRPASSRIRRENRSMDLSAETTSAGRTSKGMA